MGSSVQWRVESVKDLIKIVDHFCKYPLITEGYSDWKLFKKAFNLVQRSEHLTYEGLREIVAIKSAMNRGLSPKLKSAFPDVVRQRGENRPKVIKEIPDPQWLAGFTSAEGCVKVNIQKSPKAKLGETVNLIFQLTQHMRDEELMKILINYLVPSPPPDTPPPLLIFSPFRIPLFPLSSVEERGKRSTEERGKEVSGNGDPVPPPTHSVWGGLGGGDPPWGPIGDPPPGPGLNCKNVSYDLFFYLCFA